MVAGRKTTDNGDFNSMNILNTSITPNIRIRLAAPGNGQVKWGRLACWFRPAALRVLAGLFFSTSGGSPWRKRLWLSVRNCAVNNPMHQHAAKLFAVWLPCTLVGKTLRYPIDRLAFF